MSKEAVGGADDLIGPLERVGTSTEPLCGTVAAVTREEYEGCSAHECGTVKIMKRVHVMYLYLYAKVSKKALQGECLMIFNMISMNPK